ncbi:MAG: hypothetical protein KF809_17290 [Chloroflexi bacterium]|nr:hypothetical protein [Chloroflexota bacterium]
MARRIEPTGRLVYDARALLTDEVTASVTLVNRGDGRQRPTMWAIADAGLLFVGCRPQCRLDVEYDGTSIVSWPALDPRERKRYTVVFQAQALGAQLWTIRLDENGDGVLDGETYWDLTTRVLLR